MQDLIDKFTRCKVLVIGDAILDVYVTGITDRVCREAPAPVINLQEQKNYCGGAANTVLNLAALGAETRFLTVVGNDRSGDDLLSILDGHGVETGAIIRDPARKTIVKRRISSSYNILVRIDEGDSSPVSGPSSRSMLDILEQYLGEVDAVVVSDYGCGVVTDELIERLAVLRTSRNLALIVDAKDFRKYKVLRPKFVKPNYDECVKILEIPKRPRLERVNQILTHGESLLELTGAEGVAATMDTEGTILFENGRKPFRVSSEPRNHSETIGAGDTFISAAALAFCSGASARTAVEIASAAASIALSKEGTGICTRSELNSHFHGSTKFVTDPGELAVRVGELKRRNKKIVFTNGCFDILHRGHIAFLNQAKALGDILIIGLNTDESIRKVKGDGRPINTLEDRIAVLAALHCVNYLIAFEESSPVGILTMLKPDLFVKGGTYTVGSLPESRLVEDLGGEVKIIPFVTDMSTTKLIEKIRRPPVIPQSMNPEGRMI